MKLISYKKGEQKKIGAVNPDGRIADLTSLASNGWGMISLIETNADIERKVAQAESSDQLSDVDLLPPVERPGKIICLAGNYRAHIAESGYVEPEKRANFTQQLFLKPSTSLTGHNSEIVLVGQNVRVGWETELAVVIGKGGKDIAVGNALDHVFGYTILNDVSERGLNSQIEDRHLREMDGFCDWLAGKWFDGFAPCGPVLVTKDEVSDPHDLEIKFYLNGELRQHGNTRDMIFNISEQIAYASSIMTLEPGDIISTGTPSGAGLGDKATSLKDGDELVCEIERIGTLKNTVRWAA
ncbi:MAG TPA: fumarylacetoacetate hydrolase family protein [Pyrinomonadaceae bacterium]|jgi:2-keto-4-pentenoate hydratase/2-oxohepta-3-ene-1,7-dioic acid hydratase in catechol pathway|nr:fumarylacetoacetate hydrolase family protein [Pyrinomonadaceae bacterium]